MSKKKKRIDIGVILLALTVIFLACTAGIMKSTSTKATALAGLKAEVAAQSEANEKLQEEVDSLSGEVTDLLSTKQELLKQIEEKGLNTSIDKEQRYAYLTFDDGPSENTIKILDFLKANNIKATFFVLEKEQKGDIYRRIVEEGHTIAVHSSTHDYAQIYKSVDSFMNDIGDLASFIQKETGIKPDILRFPGGSNNTISIKYGGTNVMDEIIPAVSDAGYVYFDWNVDSMDAAKSHQDKSVIIQSVLEGARSKHEAIILMHDASAKTTTVEALPEVVRGLKEQGFYFRPLTVDTNPIQFKEPSEVVKTGN